MSGFRTIKVEDEEMARIRAEEHERAGDVCVAAYDALLGDAETDYRQRLHDVATRDAEGTYAMIYAPVGRPFSVHTNKIKGSKLKAWWFNPRTGESTLIGHIGRWEELAFRHPDAGEMIDWILVLDDASRNFPAPGTPA